MATHERQTTPWVVTPAPGGTRGRLLVRRDQQPRRASAGGKGPTGREGSHSEVEAACSGLALRARRHDRQDLSLSRVRVREQQNRLHRDAGRSTLPALPQAGIPTGHTGLGPMPSRSHSNQHRSTLRHPPSAPPDCPLPCSVPVRLGLDFPTGPWKGGDGVGTRGTRTQRCRNLLRFPVLQLKGLGPSTTLPPVPLALFISQSIRKR